MRHAALLLVFGLLTGCDTDAATDQVLVVDLLGSYQDTKVHVVVDGDEVFEGVVTTGAVLATAGQFPVDVASGRHVVQVVVEDRASARLAVHTDTTAAVGALYNPEADQVTLQASRFVYPHR